MENCLPATGVDPTSMFFVFAVLVFAGGVLAAVAVRRRRGAAMLLLVLPLFAGGLLLAGPSSPAMAVACEEPTPTPTPPCEPEEAVPNASYVDSTWFENDSGTYLGANFAEADIAGYVTLRNAVAAIDDEFDAEISVFGQQLDSVNGPIPLTTEQFAIDGTIVSIPVAAYDAAVEGFTSGSVRVEIEFTYDDGCGGILTTTVTFTAFFGTIN
jgi:LPXTG-motif cell wall-anchored protein